MMSKTHLTVGMATALALSTINTPTECAVALAGGAIGGVLADVDILKDDYKSDALIGELLAVGITAIVVGIDYILNWGICRYIIGNQITSTVGLISLAVLWIVGFSKEHRSFTHSIFAMMLYSYSIALVYPQMGTACLLGYLSHLLLDIMNKKKIQLLFPKKGGICFGWCYANKAANKVFMVLGAIATILLLIDKIVTI